MSERPHVIVLAGGEGARLTPLTRALYGRDLPKQYAVLVGDRSLLQVTIERATELTTPDRIIVVATAHHAELAREQVAPYPGVELVIQPRNLDTAPGMMLPLVRVLAKHWSARVVFLPSDHFISDTGPLHDALRDTHHGELASRISLVGVDPEGPEVDYGWIVRGARLRRTGGYQVERFHEKPLAPQAELLWREGGLWNTFIQAGPARTFWTLAAAQLPDHAAALERYATAIGGLDEEAALEHAYRIMTPANFSRDVLAHARSLAVVPVAGSGWSDWGSPSRVFASLAGSAEHDLLVGRIRGDLAIAG